MHFLLPLFLIFLSLLDLWSGEARSPWPTVRSTYPQLHSAAATTKYYHEPETHCIDIYPESQTTRPAFQAYIAQLTPIDRPTPVAGYVEVVTISDREYFIIRHGQTKFSEWLPWVGVYRVTPEVVESVLAWGPELALFSSQVGVDRGCYEYDDAGRLTRHTTWKSTPDPRTDRELYTHRMLDHWTMSIASRLLDPPRRAWATGPPEPALERLYTYWPTTGKLRTVTDVSHNTTRQNTVRHFDEYGNELKEQQ